MDYFDRLGIFVTAPAVTWTDFVSTLRVLGTRLPSWGIRVAPVSDHWLQQYEREAGKRQRSPDLD